MMCLYVSDELSVTGGEKSGEKLITEVFPGGGLLIGCIYKTPQSLGFPRISSDINYHIKRRGNKIVIMWRRWGEEKGER